MLNEGMRSLGSNLLIRNPVFLPIIRQQTLWPLRNKTILSHSILIFMKYSLT